MRNTPMRPAPDPPITTTAPAASVAAPASGPSVATSEQDPPVSVATAVQPDPQSSDPQSPSDFIVWVRWQGRTLTVPVWVCDQLSSLKTRLHDLTAVAPHRQLLSFDGLPLSPEFRLSRLAPVQNVPASLQLALLNPLRGGSSFCDDTAVCGSGSESESDLECDQSQAALDFLNDEDQDQDSDVCDHARLLAVQRGIVDLAPPDAGSGEDNGSGDERLHPPDVRGGQGDDYVQPNLRRSRRERRPRHWLGDTPSQDKHNTVDLAPPDVGSGEDSGSGGDERLPPPDVGGRQGDGPGGDDSLQPGSGGDDSLQPELRRSRRERRPRHWLGDTQSQEKKKRPRALSMAPGLGFHFFC